jgi:DNA (cytosine-5)-methyltransferase 1
MRYLSLCSGIEAASVAFKPLGWEPAAFAEVDAFPSAVLAHHYPNVPNLGDMSNFQEWPDLGPIDLICGGTPCQSFSNAGLRKGLDDPRGNLMLTFGAIVAKHRPQWVVFENVPGLLSSGSGRDFASLLGLLSGQRITQPKDGWQSSGVVAGIPDAYGLAWRVLDAQHTRVDGYPRAVPQRRHRVFVVGCLGDWRRAAAVLLERESLRGDLAPRRSTGARVAACLTRGAESSGKGGYAGRRQEDDVNIVGGALAGNGPGAGWRIGPDEAAANQLLAYGGNNTSGPISVSSALSAHGGACGRMDFESEDGTGRGAPLVPVLPFDTTQLTSAANRSNPKPGDPCHPLAAGAHAPAIAFNWQGGGTQTTLGYDPEAGTSGTLSVGQTPAVAYSTKLHNTKSNQAGKVYDGYTAGLQSNNPPPALLSAAAVRRLTPTECEALMGFPPGYTAITHRGKPAADGPRYKALGNSWAVNVARWVGRRISLVEGIK